MYHKNLWIFGGSWFIRVFQCTRGHFLKVTPKTFRTRKAIAKSKTSLLQSCCIHTLLIWTEVLCIQGGFRHIHLSVFTYRFKWLCGPEKFSRLSRKRPSDLNDLRSLILNQKIPKECIYNETFQLTLFCPMLQIITFILTWGRRDSVNWLSFFSVALIKQTPTWPGLMKNRNRTCKYYINRCLSH